MHNAAFADHAMSWNKLTTSVAATPGLPANMQADREELERALEEARSAEQRQLVHRAAAQQATRDLEAAKFRAHEAATRLRSGLWWYYGRNSTALLAFGMRPYRAARFRVGGPSPIEEAKPVAVGETLPNEDGPCVDEGEPLPITEEGRHDRMRDSLTMGNGSPTSGSPGSTSGDRSPTPTRLSAPDSSRNPPVSARPSASGPGS